MENTKRVFDESKQNELSEYNLGLGKLVDDKLFVSHHEATEEVLEQSHIEIVATYENGGQDVQTVIDVPYKSAQGAWDEYEDISIYVPYAEEELVAIREQRYRSLVESKIRQRYSINGELAILRQRDLKPSEFTEYNAYCEQCKLEANAEQVL